MGERGQVEIMSGVLDIGSLNIRSSSINIESSEANHPNRFR
jgi:hypothetical protein